MILKKLICSLSLALHVFAIERADDISQKLILETYGVNDLATNPAFQGGYINFGYWKGIWPKEGPITAQERITASEALYDLVIKQLCIDTTDKVLEVGSGRGYGCVKLSDQFSPKLVTGVDITPEQTERSQNIHKNALEKYSPKLEFLNASSSHLPFADNTYSKIYSVEAAQCFPSLKEFSKQAWRVLEPEGLLAITAHFAANRNGYDRLRKLIPTVDQGVDKLIPIQSVQKYFLKQGFTEIYYENIGQHVFEGWQQWRLQVGDVEWADNIAAAFRENFMGYYLIVFKKQTIC